MLALWEQTAAESPRSSTFSGLRKADNGEIYFDGNKAQGRQPFIQYVGYVPQENNLIPELSVMDNLRLWYSDTGALRQSIEQGFLNMLGIGSMCRMNAGKLSGGMKSVSASDARWRAIRRY